MEHRERVLRAIGHVQPDRIPCDYWATSEVTERLCRDLGQPDEESLLRYLGVDLRYVEGPSLVGQVRKEMPDGVTLDLWGVSRKVVEVPTPHGVWRYKQVVESPLASATTVAEIESYAGWPSPDWWDYSDVASQCERHAGYAVVNKGDRLDRSAQLKPMMYLRGVTQIFSDLATRPKLVEAMVDRITSYYLDYNARVFRQIQGKADIFLMGDDFGLQTGPMMSLPMWRRYFRQGFRRYVEQAHSFGLKVMHHSCGSVRYLIPEFIEAGLDILQSVQPRAKDMDLAALRREYGAHIAFHGSIDIQQTMPFGTPEDVDREVKTRMDAAREGGGFVISTAHNILPDTPTANVVALFEAYRRHGATS